MARDRELVVDARVEVDLGGTKFRNGVLDRCHPGGEFDIRYDDGTTDTYVASEKVNPAGHAVRMQVCQGCDACPRAPVCTLVIYSPSLLPTITTIHRYHCLHLG